MNEKILIREIPVVVELGDLCKNASLAHKIMIAIHEERSGEVFAMAEDIFNNNDTLIEANIDTETLRRLIDKVEHEKYN